MAMATRFVQASGARLGMAVASRPGLGRLGPGSQVRHPPAFSCATTLTRSFHSRSPGLVICWHARWPESLDEACSKPVLWPWATRCGTPNRVFGLPATASGLETCSVSLGPHSLAAAGKGQTELL